MFDNLNYYRVFYTVANTGNISKAADMLFISQPAISKAISKLEDRTACEALSALFQGCDAD